MTPSTNDNEKRMNREEPQRPESERLMQEINLLKLEGWLFCFDPKEATRRRGVITLEDARKKPVTLTIHPDFGQPSVLAYKVLQAVLMKISEQGCELTEDGRCLHRSQIAFTQRELARLVGRSTFGRTTSRELYAAVMQLRTTIINSFFYDKATDTWDKLDLQVLITGYFSGRGERITSISVEMHPKVMESFNRWHVAFFNLRRLSDLEPIGMVLYKQIFFNLSKQMYERKGRPTLSYRKDYETICREWLGGLKPLKFRSKIINEQLGRHFETLIKTGLITRYSVEKNAADDGFNIIVQAGQAFFDDYEAYYLKRSKPRVTAQTAELDEVKALSLVAHFHRALGRDHVQFNDAETTYVKDLLLNHSEAEIRDLIAYAIAEAPKTKFEMRIFNAVKTYVTEWETNQTRRKERSQLGAAVKECRLCDQAGMLLLRRNGTGELIAHPCQHKPGYAAQIEERLNAQRL